VDERLAWTGPIPALWCAIGEYGFIMGLLDDAIREHLDLKRRRGADPAELERAEREALGPVRRKGDVATVDHPDDADEALHAEAPDAPSGSSPMAYDQDEHDDWDSRDDELAVHDAEPELAPEPPRRSRRSTSNDDADHDQPRGLAARFGLRGRRSEEDEPEELDSDEPPPSDEEATRVHRSTEARADQPKPPVEGETAEHHIAGDDPDEDVLEETPEFLQDTPEHDRLWFEQRPPRDFDFDG
jgi:hypothetical protein